LQYRINPKNGDRLSALGFGCMRLPQKGRRVDEAAAIHLLRTAAELGVNYFDTAYIYHLGKSEGILGKALENGLREKVFVADKMPHYMVKSSAGLEKVFATQLSRLRTGYIDYYLIHMLSDTDAWERLKSMGIEEWIAGLKKAGQIRNIGFSFHGATAQFPRLLDAYPWDFCQIQYNYMDTRSQAGTAGLEYAAAKGLPVIIMEPLRGGRLVYGLPDEAKAIFAAAQPPRAPAEQGLRFVWARPETTVVLSGMNTLAQLEQNIKTAETALPGALTDKETVMFDQVSAALGRSAEIPCTGCGYCACPHGVDIPACFAAYNGRRTAGAVKARIRYLRDTGAMTSRPASASLCRECGACVPRCPQGISIPGELKKVAKELEGPGVRAALGAYRLLLNRKAKGTKPAP
jgi:uncharacterized protein